MKLFEKYPTPGCEVDMGDISVITSEIFVAYLQCPRKAFLLLFSEDKGKPHDYPLILEERRDQNRTRYLEGFLQSYPDAKQYEAKGFKKYEFLLNATLQSAQLEAYCATLIKVNNDSENCRNSYEPTTVAGTYSITPEQKTELLFVGLVLERIQKQLPTVGQIVTMDEKVHRVKLEKGYKGVKAYLKTLESWCSTQPPEAPALILNKHCPSCQFRDICREQAEKENNLSLLDRMTPKAIQTYNKRGIFTVQQLSYLFRPRRKRKKRKSPEPIKHSLELQALAIREQKIYIQEMPELVRQPVELFLDIEGIPDQRFHYLMGLLVCEGESSTQHSFWADTPEDEETIWKQLLAKINEYPEAPIYHYGSYEPKAFNELAKRYLTDIEKTSKYLANVNSYIYGKIYFPTFSNTLKEIGNFAGFSWTDLGASGLQSLIWIYQWRKNRNDSSKNKLLKYNIEDCLALKKIFTLLDSLKNTNNIDTFSSKDIEPRFAYNFGSTTYVTKDFDFINKCAYFNYQREKIYLRTDKNVKRALKKQKIFEYEVNKIDRYLDLVPDKCPVCDGDNIKRISTCNKIVIDLKFIKFGLKKWITHYVGGRCFDCGRTLVSKDLQDFPRKYGHNLISWAINQNVTHKIDFYKVERILLETYKISISHSTLQNFKSKVCEQYEVTLHEIKQSLVNGDFLHIDETDLSVRDFSSPYVWVFTNMNSVLYLFKPDRKADFLKDFIKDFKGVLISDFYAGYDSLPCPQQKCLIHLIRDLNQDFFKNQFNEELKTIVNEFGKLLRKVIHTVDTYGLKKRNLRKHLRDVEDFYGQAIDKDFQTDLAILYKNRFLKNRNTLFVFLNYDGVPWNNNNAEHAIKSFAYHRRNANGCFTESSVCDHLKLLSIEQTCKYRGINFLDFLASHEKSIDKYSKLI